MSDASNRNFALEQRHRERRSMANVANPRISGILPDPAWDSFWGALEEQQDEAHAQGLNFRFDGSGVGNGGGRLSLARMGRPGDEDVARNWGVNTALSEMQDERRFNEQSLRAMTAGATDAETGAQMGQRDLRDRDQMDRALGPITIPTTTTRTPGANGKPDTIRMQQAAVNPRDLLLNSVPGHMRAGLEKTLAEMDLRAQATKVDADRLAETHRHNTEMEKGTPGAGDDVAVAVAGMKEGTLPPQMPGRASKDYTKTLAEAKRQGYNLAGAVTDWSATQKHIATMNGAQQLRLNQAVNSLPDMLDKVDALAAQWDGGKFPILNKANLALAKGGAFGADAASVANQLDAQIADVVADLGNVYMGGNSPTDHALSLAGKSLSSDWDKTVLHDMVGLAKENVTIRRNSIRNTGVAGASANNTYDRQAAPVDAGMVELVAPDGKTKTAVPASQVDHYLKLGAKRVGSGG